MKNYSPWSWIGLFIGLFAVQVWIVPLVVRAVTDTEPLRGTPEQGGDSRPVSNETTDAAFAHCNHYLETARAAGSGLEFPGSPSRSWDLGFGRYMIQSSARSRGSNSDETELMYVCRIHHTGGDVTDPANWTVAGFELTPR